MKEKPLYFETYGLSDIGLSRSNNEDVWLALPEAGFFAVADGMGGHQAGEVAAFTTINSLSESANLFKKEGPLKLILELRYAIEKANQAVLTLGRLSDSYSGMGTTLCCLLWTSDIVIYAHVGDSRVYRFRKEKLELLTEDHSLFAKWLSMGKIAEECQTPYPYKNVITRAVGTKEKANPEIVLCKNEPGDLYLLCTDGLSDVLSLGDMETTLKTSLSQEIASKKLIEKAKIKGSSDNMTVLMVQKRDAKDLLRQQRNDSTRPEGPESNALGSRREPGKSL